MQDERPLAEAPLSSPIRIRLSQPIPGGEPRPAFEVVNLDDDNLARLGQSKWSEEDWKALFAVYVDAGKGVDRSAQPPMAGSYRVEDGAVRFLPQFPLTPGATYRACFDPSRLPVPGDARPLEEEFAVPRPESAPTVVENVFPTRQFVPENLLKFYIHFSAPMRKGEAYKHIRLIRQDMEDNKHVEKVIERPFLELDEELWDPSGRRFTLLIDPGRIKRGLKPREDLGPALEEDRLYALAISRDWRDAAGYPLAEAFRKDFRVLGPDEEIPDPKTWRLIAPPAATVEPVTIDFPEPMDQALLERCLWVVDSRGRKRPGSVRVKFEELRWEFTPEDVWQVGKYHVVVDTNLEDLAGNNLRRPFEVDVFKKVDRQVKTETIAIPFEVPIPGQGR